MENGNNEEKSTYFFGRKKEGATDGLAKKILPQINPANEIKSGPEEKSLDMNIPKKSNEMPSGEKVKGAFGEEVPEKEEKNGAASRIAGSMNTATLDLGAAKASSNIPFTMPSGVKKKSPLLPLAIGAVVLLAVGGAAAYYLYVAKGPAENGENPKQKILRTAMTNTGKAKTYNYNGDIQYGYTGEVNGEKQSMSIKMNLSGTADESDAENPKSSSNMNISMQLPVTGMEDQNFTFDLDMMSFGKETAYYRLNNVDLGSSFIGAIYGSALNPYKGRWYFLDAQKLKELSSTSGPAANLDTETFMKLYNENEFLVFKDDKGDTKVGDVDAYHFGTAVDGKKFVSFYLALAQETSSTYTKDGEAKKSLLESIEKLKKDVEKYNDVVNYASSNIASEVWIGKRDNYLYRIKLDGKLDDKFMKMLEEEMMANNDMPAKSDESSAEKGEATIMIDLNVSDFDKSVEINKPENAEDLTKMLEGMLGGFGSPNTSSGANNSQYDSDNDGLADNMEEFYGTSAQNPDSDGDGFKDGNEVENGYDPAKPGNVKLDYDKMFAPQK